MKKFNFCKHKLLAFNFTKKEFVDNFFKIFTKKNRKEK